MRKTVTADTYAVVAIAISPDGRTLATGAFEGTVGLWDVATATNTRKMRGHTAVVNFVAFSPDGKYVVSSGEDVKTNFWEVASGKATAVVYWGDCAAAEPRR